MNKKNIILIGLIFSMFIILLFVSSCKKEDVKTNNTSVNTSKKNSFSMGGIEFTFVTHTTGNSFPNGSTGNTFLNGSNGNTFPNGASSNSFQGSNCLTGTWVSGDSILFCSNMKDIFQFYTNGTGIATIIENNGPIPCVAHYCTFVWQLQNGLLNLHLVIPDIGIEGDVQGNFSCPTSNMVLGGLYLIKSQ